MVRKDQEKIFKAINGRKADRVFEPKVKPQLSPCFTTYPSSLAANAAIGLTAFLEYEAQTSSSFLAVRLKDFIRNPERYFAAKVDKKRFRKIAKMVAHWVGKRITLEDLRRRGGLSSVEIYRLFAASHERLSFETFDDIIKTVVLYGDILPSWSAMDLHPISEKLLRALRRSSRVVFNKLVDDKEVEFFKVGQLWVSTLCAEFIPYCQPPPRVRFNTHFVPQRKTSSQARYQKVASPSPGIRGKDDNLAPLEGKHPPELFPLSNVGQHALRAIQSGDSSKQDEPDDNNATVDSDTMTTLKHFNQTVENAAGQHNDWEDMRSDRLERILGDKAFSASPLEGMPVEGHEVAVNYGNKEVMSGEVFDRSIDFSNNYDAGKSLAEMALPITKALRRNLYPNLEESVHLQRLRTSGSLDPSRLAYGDFSNAIFKRFRVRAQPYPRGQAVLAIACDGSGSLSAPMMQMVKLLSGGYLLATKKNDVILLMALYHSGSIRKGSGGPLVQWMHHPQKTTNRTSEALAAVATLPDKGTGIQSDALSVTFILEEAKRLAKGKTIYLVVISDTAWNRSFHTNKSGHEEMFTSLKAAYDEPNKRLNITLIALGCSEDTGFEDMLDAVVKVPADDLQHPEVVAEKIGVHVARSLKQRRSN